MHRLFKQILALSCTSLILTALPTSAAGFWVGFDGVRSQRSGFSTLRYVSVIVSSGSQSDPPQSYEVVMTLFASPPDGFFCSISTEITKVFPPSVTMPVQFQIYYWEIPADVTTPGAPQTTPRAKKRAAPSKLPPKEAVIKLPPPPVPYTLAALIHSIQPQPPGWKGPIKHSSTVNFPAGGKPSCQRLPCPQGASCYPPYNP